MSIQTLVDVIAANPNLNSQQILSSLIESGRAARAQQVGHARSAEEAELLRTFTVIIHF